MASSELMKHDLSFLKSTFRASPAEAAHQFEEERKKRPEKKDNIDEIATFYDQKLYHQFTEAFEKYLTETDIDGQDCAALLFAVVFPLKEKLNLLKVIGFIRHAASKMSPDEALFVISSYEPLVTGYKVAQLSLLVCKANVLTKAGRLENAGDLLSDVTSRLKAEIGIDLCVNSAFYEACANYFRANGDLKQLYDVLLLFLAYTPLNQLKDKVQLAFELCVTGLVAPGMFDFGDLRMNPILTTLEGDPNLRWILDFVNAAVDGSLSKYKAALQKHKRSIKTAFGRNLKQLDEKMTLAALIELAFQQPKRNRKLSFREIETHCDVQISQCERLIMRAMSLGLIKGSIDSITSELYITWVKPRLVDAERVGILKSRFSAWSDNIKQLTTHLESIMPDTLTT